MSATFEPTVILGTLPITRPGGGLAAMARNWLGALRGTAAAQDGLVDAATGLLNRLGLSRRGDAMFMEARAASRPTTMLVLNFADLLEVHAIYGRRIGRDLLDRVVSKLKLLAGRRGVVARTGRVEFTVLLPGVGRERAQAQVDRILGKPCRIEFEAGGEEVVLVPEVAVLAAPAELESVDELYRDAVNSLERARAFEERRQHHLQRELYRHSRPMSSWPASQPMVTFAHPATIPAPLGGRARP